MYYTIIYSMDIEIYVTGVINEQTNYQIILSQIFLKNLLRAYILLLLLFFFTQGFDILWTSPLDEK